MIKLTPADIKVQWGNKTFNSFDDIDFDDIIVILDDWQAERVDSGDVNGFAETIFMKWGPNCLPELPLTNPREILAEFIMLFDNIFGEVLLREDIPALKDILILGQYSPEIAFKKLSAFFKTIDINARQKMVENRLSRGLDWPS